MVTMGGCGGVQGGRWILLPQKDNNELVIAFFFAILKLYTPQAPTPRNKTRRCTELWLVAGRKTFFFFF